MMRVTSLMVLCLCSCKADKLSVVASTTDTETFSQEAAPRIDVLWVVDNSATMGAEQQKIVNEAAHFLLRLETIGLDYHVGVVTTDPGDAGQLRAFSGTGVATCAGCRYVSASTGCRDAEALASEIQSAPLNSTDLGARCPALQVFQDLVQVGTVGSALERGFSQAAMALGLDMISGGRGTLPATNEGFLRDDADLMILFVSDENEGFGNLDVSVHYFERLFGGLKKGGQRVSVSTIAGWPLADQLVAEGIVLDYQVTVDQEICATYGPLLRGLQGNSQAVADLNATIDDNYTCRDEATPGEQQSLAYMGLRYIKLACRMGGQVVSICRRDFRAGLTRLADSIVRLSVAFPLARAAQLDWGDDCQPFTDDDGRMDCDGNGSLTDAIDGPLCVTAQSDAMPRGLVERGDNGWQWEPITGAIVFPGTFVPQTSSPIEVQELMRPVGRRCVKR